MKGRNSSGDLDVDGILKKYLGGGGWLDSSASGLGPVVDSYEHGNGLSSSIKADNFLIGCVTFSFSRMT
jgi:hypothetical protein